MSRRAGARALLAGALTCALLAAAPGDAVALYAPTGEYSFSTTAPAAAPAVTAVLRTPRGDEPTRLIATRFPPDFTYNPAFAVTGCSLEDEAAATCPASSRMGTATVQSELGPAAGDVFLTADYRLFLPLRAVGGLYTQRVVGRIHTLDDGSFELVFDDLPAFQTTESRISLEGGPKSLFINPRECGRYELGARLINHSGTEVKLTFPLEISGCAAPPEVEQAAVAPARTRRGRGVTITWRLSGAATQTVVELFRLTGGIWRSYGRVRRPAAAGSNRLRVGRTFAGRRLQPGRHRVVLRAVGGAGEESRATSAAFVVSR